MCDCVATVNAKLSERNTRLHEPILIFGGKRLDGQLFVETEQVERGRGKAKAVSMLTSYCPFCGEKHAEEKDPLAVETKVTVAVPAVPYSEDGTDPRHA
jgi:hypothetical protein